jgi:uncharacterized protein YggT (Ycf19 family)
VEIPDGVETRVDFALDLYEWLEQGRINRQIRIREEHGAWTTLEALSHYQRRRRFLIASVNSFASLAIIVATVWRYVLNGAGGWGVGSWAFLQLLFVVIASWVGGGFDNKIIMIIASIVTPALGLLASILAPTSFWEYWWIHAIVTPAVWYFAMRVEG